MRILQVAGRTYPAKGGSELHTIKISKALAERGHHVTLVVFNALVPRDCGYGITYQKPYLVTKSTKPSLPKEEWWNGVRILRFESKMQIFSYFWSPKMLAWLLKNAKEFDIMHTHLLRYINNEFVALAHMKSGRPFILTSHDKLKLDYMGRLASTIDLAYRWSIGRSLLRLADRLIAFDEDYAEDYRKLYGVPDEKIRIIPNGIDYDYYNRLPNSDKIIEPLGNSGTVVLYIGRFIDYKRPDLLIASFKLVLKRFPESFLLMIGKDYGLLPYCKKLAIELGMKEKVIFLEDANEETKLQALRTADACVIPSDYESFGLVALEAEACGVPLVASKCGGLKNLLIEGKTGFFLEKRTPEEIAEKIILLLSDSRLRKQMGINARGFAKNFSWDTVTDKLLRVYEEVLKYARAC